MCSCTLQTMVDVPWDEQESCKRHWIEGYFNSHPRPSESRSCIYEARMVTANEQPRLREPYHTWAETLAKLQPAADHIENTVWQRSFTIDNGVI